MLASWNDLTDITNYLNLVNTITGLAYRIGSRINSSGQKLDSWAIRLGRKHSVIAYWKLYYVQWFK